MKIWCSDFRDSIYTDAFLMDGLRYSRIDMMFGHSVQTDFPADASIQVRSKRPPSDFFEAGSFPVVSARIRAILDDHKVVAEYMPVALRDQKGESFTGSWFCFNVTAVADCLDREKSQFTRKGMWATGIKRVAIDENKCSSQPLVLAAKTNPYLLVVQDNLASEIIGAGCSGVVFRDQQNWRNPIDPVD